MFDHGRKGGHKCFNYIRLLVAECVKLGTNGLSILYITKGLMKENK